MKKILTALAAATVLLLVSIFAVSTTSAAPKNGNKNGNSNIIRFDAIAAKPTAWGREVEELRAFQGKLWVGYGDWNANGRVTPQVYDPATGEISAAPTTMGNADHFMQVWDNELYVVGPESGGVHIFNGTDWRRGGCCVHEFATVKRDGVIYVSGQGGASGNDGVVKASYDGGLTYQQIFTDPNSFRFHGMGALGDTLYVFGQGHDWSMDFNTGVWTAGHFSDSFNMMYRSETFKDQILGISWYPTTTTGGRYLYAFDGTVNRYITSGIDYTIQGDYVYLLDAGGTIRRSTDLSHWQQVAKVNGGGRNGSDARSIELIDNVLYVGMTEARVKIIDLNKGGGPNK